MEVYNLQASQWAAIGFSIDGKMVSVKISVICTLSIVACRDKVTCSFVDVCQTALSTWVVT